MDFSLIETLRWQPETGFLRLDQHLRRLARSADALGFRQPQDPKGKLEKEVTGEAALRVRLVMSFRGKMEITATPFEAEPEEKVWRLKIAKTRLQSEDSLFRHKTSRRDPYEAARAEFAKDEADEVILLNERDEVCEGTITNVFAEAADGTLLTPPLTGVLRAELIRERKARGEVLKLDDLRHRRLFVGNSLRGLIRAELIE